MALHHCRRLAEQHGLGARPRAKHAVSFLSGAVAGAAGTVASYPFDLLRTTLAAQGEPKVYASMTDAARGIVRASGVAGLYRGLGITVLEIMPYAALQFGLYDIFMAMSTRAWVSSAPVASTHGLPLAKCCPQTGGRALGAARRADVLPVGAEAEHRGEGRGDPGRRGSDAVARPAAAS